MNETLVARLTPAGRGAVAVVLVTGPAATDCVARCFHAASGRPLGDAPLNRILLGHWGASDGEELIVCRRSVDEVEVHCHGGDAAVRAVIDALVAQGCIECSRVSPKLGSESRRDSPTWGFAPRRDSTTWDAHVALASATTLRTAVILLDQLNGALSNAIQNALAALADSAPARAAAVLDDLLQHSELGLHLTTPWRVVLAGPPNVGKSSLINALAGYERAIVSPIAGTTRDVVTVNTAIDGWPVTLADTAGLRTASDVLEAAGVELATTALDAADLAVLVDDATCPTTEQYLSRLPERVLRVRNKIDLAVAGLCEAGASPIQPGSQTPATELRPSLLNTSAVTGQGIAELIAAIGSALVPHPPSPGAAVPFTSEQVASLQTARAAVAAGDIARASSLLNALLADAN